MNRYYIKRKIDAVIYKGGSCVRCGYNKCYGSLHFHHRDPATKRFDWPQLKCQRWSTVLEELDKCDLLCANCHGEEHQDQKLAEDALVWLATHKKPPKRKRGKYHKNQECCKGCKEPLTKKSQIEYCSRSCASTAHQKIAWPENSVLARMVQEQGLSKTGRELGVSHTSIRRRMKKINGTEVLAAA